jgi:hypothetical protein
VDVPYQPYYCEENAYRICQTIIDGVDGDWGDATRSVDWYGSHTFGASHGPSRGALLFIFGVGEWVAVHHQTAAEEGRPVYWDYHVVAVVGSAGGERSGTPDDIRWFALDPDSRLPFGYPLSQYLTATFPPGTPGAPRFRRLPWEEGREWFGSDRRHMRDGNGGWLQPPPPWPMINPEHHRLPECLTRSDNGIGTLYTYRELIGVV